MQKAPYRVDLQALHALCEANYLRLMRLFPDYELSNRRRIVVRDARVEFLVLERARYTTSLRMIAEQATSKLLGPLHVELRAYHDAAMLEVTGFQSSRLDRARYVYPNPDMLQEDEKYQQNLFLGECLERCLADGEVPLPVFTPAAPQP